MSHTHTHTLQYQEINDQREKRKQGRAAKLPARFGSRDGLDGERGTTFEKGLLEGAAARQKEINRGRDGPRDTMRNQDNDTDNEEKKTQRERRANFDTNRSFPQ